MEKDKKKKKKKKKKKEAKPSENLSQKTPSGQSPPYKLKTS